MNSKVVYTACLVACLTVCVPPGMGGAAVKSDADWRERFDAVYRLDDGEVLRRVAPPFIPERDEYYRSAHGAQAEAIADAPDYFIFHYDQDGGSRNWGYGFSGHAMTVRGALGNVLGLNSYEVEGPNDLLSHELPGDWVVRPAAPLAAKLDALGSIIRDATKRGVRFEPHHVERDVIVATGTFKATPMAVDAGDRSIHVFADKVDQDERGGGGGGSLDEFLRMLGSHLGTPVVNETEGNRPDWVRWSHHTSSYLTREAPGPRRDEKVSQMLGVVSEQTNLRFRTERRKVAVWRAAEVSR